MAVSLHAPGRCIVSARAGARHARIPCRSLVVAAAGADFSPEQQAASLQHQLRKSQQAAAEAAASKATAGMAETHSRIPTKKAPRREARAAAAAAAAEAEGAARQQSLEAQQQLRRQAEAMDAALIAAALRTQLRQSGTFDEAEPSSTSRAPAASNGSAGPAASAPVDIHEDGSMLFKF